MKTMKKKRYVSPANVIVALNRVRLLTVSGGDKVILFGGEDIDGLIEPA